LANLFGHPLAANFSGDVVREANFTVNAVGDQNRGSSRPIGQMESVL
jgi:hypothetical protein